MKGAAFGVIALGSREVEALTDRHVVIEEIARDGFWHWLISCVYRHHVDEPARVVHADDVGLDALERHQQHQGDCYRQRTYPPSTGDPPGDTGAAPLHGDAVRVPGGGL